MPRGGGRGGGEGGDDGGGGGGDTGPVVKQRTRSVKGRRVRKMKRRGKSARSVKAALQIGEKKKKKQEGSY